MYYVSSALASAFRNGCRQVAEIYYRENASAQEVLIANSSNILRGGLGIDRQCPFGVGSAVASELTLALRNTSGEYNNYDFSHGIFRVRIGTANWTADNPVVEYVPCGIFYGDEVRKTQGGRSIWVAAIDGMSKFDTPVDWSQVTFPITIQNLVSVACSACGVQMATSISGYPNHAYEVAAAPPYTSLTWRTILRWCAQIMGVNAYMDWNGALRLEKFAGGTVPTTWNVLRSERFNSEVLEEGRQVTGIRYTGSDGTEISVGDDTGYVFTLGANGLISSPTAAIFSAILSAFNQSYFYSGTVEMYGAPFLWPMDKIVYQPDGYSIPVTGITHYLNGHTRIAGDLESTLANDNTLADDTYIGVARYEKIEPLLDSIGFRATVAFPDGISTSGVTLAYADDTDTYSGTIGIANAEDLGGGRYAFEVAMTDVRYIATPITCTLTYSATKTAIKKFTISSLLCAIIEAENDVSSPSYRKAVAMIDYAAMCNEVEAITRTGFVEPEYHSTYTEADFTMVAAEIKEFNSVFNAGASGLTIVGNSMAIANGMTGILRRHLNGVSTATIVSPTDYTVSGDNYVFSEDVAFKDYGVMTRLTVVTTTGTATLDTCPMCYFSALCGYAGLTEVYKHAIIASTRLWQALSGRLSGQLPLILPQPPNDNGNYQLIMSVADGVVTYAWELVPIEEEGETT